MSETRWVCERDVQTRQWTIKNVRGKNWKVLKTVLEAQNMRFSRLNQVANKSPNTLETKFLKNFLSVFRDWDVHLQVSRKGSRENFNINSQLEFPLSNKSPNQVARTLKIQNFEKISKSFSQQGLWPASESRKPSV